MCIFTHGDSAPLPLGLSGWITVSSSPPQGAICNATGDRNERDPQEAWTVRKVEEIQGYADRNGWKNFVTVVKAVYGATAKETAPILSTDGTALFSEKAQIQQRWTENFRGILSRPSTISDAAIASLSQVETDADLNLPPSPRNHHCRAAVLQWKSAPIGQDPF
nr:unnamed protein product [Spirometra erinaceieuropaei]